MYFFVKFKKREKQLWRSDTFKKFQANTPLWVLFTLLF